MEAPKYDYEAFIKSLKFNGPCYIQKDERRGHRVLGQLLEVSYLEWDSGCILRFNDPRTDYSYRVRVSEYTDPEISEATIDTPMIYDAMGRLYPGITIPPGTQPDPESVYWAHTGVAHSVHRMNALGVDSSSSEEEVEEEEEGSNTETAK